MPTGKVGIAQSAWNTSLQEFGEQLRDRRTRVLRLSQAAMAARVGLDQSSISRIEAGGKPRDKATTVTLADAYRLTQAETKAWLELLYGSTTIYPNGDAAMENLSLEYIYTLLERLRGDTFDSHRYDYFDPDRNGSVDREMIAVVDWFFANTHHLPRAHLLVEFGAVLMHYLNGRGQYRRRLALALVAADAAQELERRTVEGWLRSDAIPWTLMEQQRDAAAAQLHLKRGLTLAKALKNPDMEALALAFQARTYMIAGDNRHARANLTRARRLDPAPAVQARVDWIDGDLALRQKHYDKAFTFYRAAEAADVGQGSGHHTVVTPLFRLGDLYLRLFDLPAAKQVYVTLLSDMRPPLVGARLARAFFGLARVVRFEGDMAGARRLADEALAALATADDDPQFRQIIGLFVGSLPA